MIEAAAQAVSDTTRRALDDLEQLGPDAAVRAIVVVLDVEGDGQAQVLLKANAGTTLPHVHGLLLTAASLAVRGFEREE